MKLIRISSAFVRHTLFGLTMTPRDTMLQWPGPAGPDAWCLMTWEVSSSCSQAAADPGCHNPPPGLGELRPNVKKQSNPFPVHEIPVSQIIFFFLLLLFNIIDKEKKSRDKMLTTCSKLPHSEPQPSSAARHDDHMLHVQFCSNHSWHDSWLRWWSGLGRVSLPAPGM